MQVNPYKSPETVALDQPVVPYLDMGHFELIGNTIHCGPQLFLPMYCVLTGAEEDLEFVECGLRHMSWWGRLLWILLLPISTVFPVGPWLLRRGLSSSCAVSYFVARRIVVRSRWLFRIGCIPLFAALVWTLAVVPDVRSDGIIVLAGPVCLVLLVAAFAVFLSTSPAPLRTVGCRHGPQWRLLHFMSELDHS